MDSKPKMMLVRDAILEVTGMKISMVSAWRFCTVGQAGIRLRYWMLGGRKLTTIEEVTRWMDQVTAAREGGLPPVESAAKQAKRLSRVDRELDKEFA